MIINQVAYEQDLSTSPGNLWALKGLLKCLLKMQHREKQQPNVDEAGAGGGGGGSCRSSGSSSPSPSCSSSCCTSSLLPSSPSVSRETRSLEHETSKSHIELEIASVRRRIMAMTKHYCPKFTDEDSCLCAGHPIVATN